MSWYGIILYQKYDINIKYSCEGYNIFMPESKTYTTSTSSHHPGVLTGVHRPELLPRRGEFSAWALTIAIALGFYFLTRPGPAPGLAWFFVIFFAVSAASISLGNWMDRKTFIRIESDGVVFENGLRKSHLTWDAIKEVRTSRAQWGISVQVIGPHSAQSHFAFSTLGEMQFRGKVRARTGFADGKFILDEIIRAAGLTKMTQDGQFNSYSRP
jgi:hypothetical protein